jgi:hypothetical protein
MLDKLLALLPKPFKALAIRFDRSPLDSVETLSEFVRTRSSYVAQTSLYGYLKARMGTRFPQFFEDDVFSVSIRIASARLYVSCLGDMTIYAVAYAVKDAGFSNQDAVDLASFCFRTGMERTLVDLDPDAVSPEMSDDFARRAAQTDWAAALDPIPTFAGSERDIIRFAPVIDQFKTLDREIVGNSIRFRWRDVREQLKSRLAADGVADDWRRLAAATSRS